MTEDHKTSVTTKPWVCVKRQVNSMAIIVAKLEDGTVTLRATAIDDAFTGKVKVPVWAWDDLVQAVNAMQDEIDKAKEPDPDFREGAE